MRHSLFLSFRFMVIAASTCLTPGTAAAIAGLDSSGDQLVCPGEQAITIGTEVWVDSLAVHNPGEIPILVSYLLTDSQGWICNNSFSCYSISGIQRIDPGRTLLIGPNLGGIGVPVSIPVSVPPETISEARFQVRHQDSEVGPDLTITLVGIGDWDFHGLQEWNSWPEVQVDPGQLLEFRWDSPGNRWRYGADVMDVYNRSDHGWGCDFIGQYNSFMGAFNEGTHGFVVQVMDEDALVTMGGVRVVVIPQPEPGKAMTPLVRRTMPEESILQESTPWYDECEFQIRAVASIGNEPTSWGALKSFFR